MNDFKFFSLPFKIYETKIKVIVSNLNKTQLRQAKLGQDTLIVKETNKRKASPTEYRISEIVKNYGHF